MMKSWICWLVMVIGFLASIWMVRNMHFNGGAFFELSVLGFIILFPVSLACNIRLLKSKYRELKAAKKLSILNFIVYGLGFASLQTCLVSGFCGVSGFVSVMMLVFPSYMVNAFVEYSVYVLAISDILLFASLFFMKCFHQESNKVSLTLK